MHAGLLTSPEFGRLAPAAIALIPLGAFEQHGPHLPLLTDTLIAETLAARAEKALPNQVLLLPSLWYGPSAEHAGFPGTLSLGAISFIDQLTQLLGWLEAGGVRRTLLYSAHGGNQSAAKVACEEYSRQHLLKASFLYAYTPLVQRQAKALFGIRESHGGSTESSLLAALRPDLCSAIPPSHTLPTPSGGELLSLFTAQELSADGILQATATVETDPLRGEQLAQGMLEEAVRVIQALLGLELS